MPVADLRSRQIFEKIEERQQNIRLVSKVCSEEESK